MYIYIYIYEGQWGFSRAAGSRKQLSCAGGLIFVPSWLELHVSTSKSEWRNPHLLSPPSHLTASPTTTHLPVLAKHDCVSDPFDLTSRASQVTESHAIQPLACDAHTILARLGDKHYISFLTYTKIITGFLLWISQKKLNFHVAKLLILVLKFLLLNLINSYLN